MFHIQFLFESPMINIMGLFFSFFKKNKGKYLFVRNISYLWFMKEQNMPLEPTRSELEILQVLWENGPSTVRFVNDKLNEEKRAVQYTSTLKLMQIMVEKGMLTRDESQMKHVYIPAAEEHKTKGFLLERFVDTMYKGSASSLMMQLLGNKKTSKKELEAIKELLKKMDR
jgi:BlaI family penicillinase repressor